MLLRSLVAGMLVPSACLAVTVHSHDAGDCSAPVPTSGAHFSRMTAYAALDPVSRWPSHRAAPTDAVPAEHTLRSDRASEQQTAAGINVLDFCKGDGVTDDTACFRSALAAVPPTGGTLIVPSTPGGYLISGGLRPRAGTIIQGSGYGSWLKMMEGGWDSYAEDHEYADNLGLLSILRSNVRITGLRITGTLAPLTRDPRQPEYRYDPQLITIAGTSSNPVTNVTVDHCWLEDNAWNGIWPSGVHASTTHLRFTDNHFRNIGRFVDHGGNPDRVALQLNGQHILATRNDFHRCGNAISATGSFQVVSNNVIRDCWQGVLFGDTPGVIGVEIVDNDISAEIAPGGDWATPSAVTGIYGNAGGQPFGHDAQLARNSVHFVLSTTAVKDVVGILTDGVDVLLTENRVSFDVECAWSTGTTNRAIGLSIEANGNSGTTARLRGNTVWAYSLRHQRFDDGRGMGLRVHPGPSKTLTVRMADNSIRGFEAGTAVAVNSTPAAGTLTQYVDGELISGGAALYGSSSVTSFNLPVRLSRSSAPVPAKPAGAAQIDLARSILGPTFASTILVDASVADQVVVRPPNARAFTISAPTDPPYVGKVLTFTIANQNRRALGPVTWAGGHGGYHLTGGAWLQPGAMRQRSIAFCFDGTGWLELRRSGEEVSK